LHRQQQFSSHLLLSQTGIRRISGAAMATDHSLADIGLKKILGAATATDSSGAGAGTKWTLGAGTATNPLLQALEWE
jgi:hypothetical protein